jgi:hypothetical protein
MVLHNQDTIENFIRKNRDKFSAYDPAEGHMDKFLSRMRLRLRKIISIVPYLIRVSIATLLVFISSVLIWNSYLRKDRHEITLKDKVTLIISHFRNH